MQRMLQTGWCSARVEDLKMMLLLSGMLYIANMPKLDDEEHGECSLDLCQYANISNTEYKSSHDEGCDGCKHIEPGPNRLNEILTNGSYPLMDLHRDKSEITISLQEFSTKTPYVAKSHVWSDGLGNVDRNSIPRYQYACLSKLVRDIAKTFPDENISNFWLDTVCCPVVDGSHIQNLVTHKMKETYQNAKIVLIRDSYLMKQKARDLQDVQILMTLLCCRWTTRLW